jgi:hypothetical protein
MKKLTTAIVVGAIVLVGQHLLAAEGESWLKRWRLWPGQ